MAQEHAHELRVSSERGFMEGRGDCATALCSGRTCIALRAGDSTFAPAPSRISATSRLPKKQAYPSAWKPSGDPNASCVAECAGFEDVEVPARLREQGGDLVATE